MLNGKCQLILFFAARRWQRGKALQPPLYICGALISNISPNGQRYENVHVYAQEGQKKQNRGARIKKQSQKRKKYARWS